jgi:hypothetical protein
MAVVYLTRDVKHDRPVGFKVVRPDVADAVKVEQFVCEIRIVAHPPTPTSCRSMTWARPHAS